MKTDDVLSSCIAQSCLPHPRVLYDTQRLYYVIELCDKCLLRLRSLTFGFGRLSHNFWTASCIRYAPGNDVQAFKINWFSTGIFCIPTLARRFEIKSIHHKVNEFWRFFRDHSRRFTEVLDRLCDRLYD